MIEVRALWFSYIGENYILKDINITIKEGEFIAILGDNGAGKTTLIKHFNGLLKPKKGSVTVDGIDTKKATVATLSRKVGIVFQYPETMFFSETVKDEIEFALKNFGFDEAMRKKRIQDVLTMLWLKNYEERSPFTLSGGEQRRLALACVLAWDPKYIVMDEPTAGQDRFQREILIDIIKTLRRRGKGVVIVTHDVEFVAELKPRVVVMKDGVIIADGNAEEILSDEGLMEHAGLITPVIAKITKNLKEYSIKTYAINIIDLINVIESRVK